MGGHAVGSDVHFLAATKSACVHGKKKPALMAGWKLPLDRAHQGFSEGAGGSVPGILPGQYCGFHLASSSENTRKSMGGIGSPLGSTRKAWGALARKCNFSNCSGEILME